MTNPFWAQRQLQQQRSDLILAYYAMLKSQPGDLQKRLILEWKCSTPNPKRTCVLLHGLRSPEYGDVIIVPGYRFSSAVNDQVSNAAGRAKNTFDGDRRWLPRASLLSGLDSQGVPGAGVDIALQCSHFPSLPVSADEMVEAARSGRPGRPHRRVLPG